MIVKAEGRFQSPPEEFLDMGIKHDYLSRVQIIMKKRKVYTVEQTVTLGGVHGGFENVVAFALLCFHFSAQLLAPLCSCSLSLLRTF